MLPFRCGPDHQSQLPNTNKSITATHDPASQQVAQKYLPPAPASAYVARQACSLDQPRDTRLALRASEDNNTSDGSEDEGFTLVAVPQAVSPCLSSPQIESEDGFVFVDDRLALESFLAQYSDIERSSMRGHQPFALTDAETDEDFAMLGYEADQYGN